MNSSGNQSRLSDILTRVTIYCTTLRSMHRPHIRDNHLINLYKMFDMNILRQLALVIVTRFCKLLAKQGLGRSSKINISLRTTSDSTLWIAMIAHPLKAHVK